MAAGRQPVRLSPAPALWFCVYLPDLALRVCGLDPDNPGAVFETVKGREFVYEASPAARAAGVRPGLPLAQARALCEDLQVRSRRPAAERRALQRLAGRLVRFTPSVSLAPPRALLLEVRASLKLFGGPEMLREALRETLDMEDGRFAVAAAPTPLATLWLARLDRSDIVTDRNRLRSALGRLPVTVLPLPADRLQRLAKTGVHELQDLWRLPRDGLARRFGPQLLLAMDRALGFVADPQPVFEPAERFKARQELPWEVADATLLMPAVERLVSRLCRFLRNRGAGVTRLRLTLYHVKAPPSRLDVGLRRATRDRSHLLHLIETRLDRQRLPAPVVALGLVSEPIRPLVPENPVLGLSPAPSPDGEGKETYELDWQRLLDQFEARLGAGRLHFPETRADHRPERAFSRQGPAASANVRTAAERPLWLLPTPGPLAARPRLVSGPERIESGWWDGDDCRRDYYIATESGGRRLWVFRNLEDGNWYLHGLFD